MITSVIGIDPGPSTGICFLDYNGAFLAGKLLLQTDADSAVGVLNGMLLAYYSNATPVTRKYASIEKFVTGRSAASRGPAADTTRQLVMELAELLQMFSYHTKIRAAATVKPWATDRRLEKATIIEARASSQGSFRHAYDGARQALYGAHWDAGIKDPLALCFR